MTRQEMLDDSVHEMCQHLVADALDRTDDIADQEAIIAEAGARAIGINNEGPDAQRKFLLQQMGW